MERRKFLIGMGSAAAGTSAIVGSGAFNFANVERGVNVNIADDSEAFLALNDTSEYADGSDKALRLTFDSDATVEGNGKGINENSDYSFTRVFSIRNQGNQPVGVWISDDDSNDAAQWYGVSTNENPDNFTNSIEGNDNSYSLDVGEEVYVNVVLFNQDNDASDLPNTINVVADSSAGGN